MKSSLLTLLLLVSLIGGSDAKIHLTDTANRWMMYEVYGGNVGEYGYKIETIQLGRDTIIRGKTYRASRNYTSSSYYSHGYFREDTVADEVWGIVDYGTLKYRSDTVEHLIYKGSWQIGDTTTMYNGRIRIISIDSTEIEGEQYKVFYTRCLIDRYEFPLTIIEGIGSLKGLGFPIYPLLGEFDVKLLCFFHGTDKPILNPAIDHFDNTGSCTLGVLTTPKSSPQVFVRPNPGSENISLILPSGMKKSSVVLTDFSGRLIAQFETNTTNTAIGQYLRTPGIYFYRVQDKSSGQSYQGRFVFR